MSASAIAATISHGSASLTVFSGGGGLSGLTAGSRGLSAVGSPVSVVASAGIIRREPEQFVPSYRQPTLAGNVSNLASQPAVIVAVGRAWDGLDRQRCCAFI